MCPETNADDWFRLCLYSAHGQEMPNTRGTCKIFEAVGVGCAVPTEEYWPGGPVSHNSRPTLQPRHRVRTHTRHDEPRRRVQGWANAIATEERTAAKTGATRRAGAGKGGDARVPRHSHGQPASGETEHDHP